MLPDKIALSGTEHATQAAFFQWINYAARFGFTLAYRICVEKLSPSIANEILVDDLYRGKNVSLPELKLMHSIPNGGHRDKRTASMLKSEGVRAGVFDTFLPVTKEANIEQGYDFFKMNSGLYIEFKAASKRNQAYGGLSLEQVKFADDVRGQGYIAEIAYTWREAANLVMLYFGYKFVINEGVDREYEHFT